MEEFDQREESVHNFEKSASINTWLLWTVTFDDLDADLIFRTKITATSKKIFLIVAGCNDQAGRP